MPSDGRAGDADEYYMVPIYWTQEYWRRLAYSQQQAALNLGYTPLSWDAGITPPSLLKRWDQLDSRERAGAIELGYSERFWNYRAHIYTVEAPWAQRLAAAPIGAAAAAVAAAAGTRAALEDLNLKIGAASASAEKMADAAAAAGERIAAAAAERLGEGEMAPQAAAGGVGDHLMSDHLMSDHPNGRREKSGERSAGGVGETSFGAGFGAMLGRFFRPKQDEPANRPKIGYGDGDEHAVRLTLTLHTPNPTRLTLHA